MGFPPEPLFSLLDSHAFKIQNTIISLLFLTFKAGRKSQKSSNEAGVKVAMKPIHTIGRILPSPKDPLTLEEKSCLVYQVLVLIAAVSFTLDKLNGTLSHV